MLTICTNNSWWYVRTVSVQLLHVSVQSPAQRLGSTSRRHLCALKICISVPLHHWRSAAQTRSKRENIAGWLHDVILREVRTQNIRTLPAAKQDRGIMTFIYLYLFVRFQALSSRLLVRKRLQVGLCEEKVSEAWCECYTRKAVWFLISAERVLTWAKLEVVVRCSSRGAEQSLLLSSESTPTETGFFLNFHIFWTWFVHSFCVHILVTCLW